MGLAYYRYAVDKGEGRSTSAAGRGTSAEKQRDHPCTRCMPGLHRRDRPNPAPLRVSRRGTPARFSKLELLRYFYAFPYMQEVLRDALAPGAPPPVSSSSCDADAEKFCWAHHPLLRAICARSPWLSR